VGAMLIFYFFFQESGCKDADLIRRADNFLEKGDWIWRAFLPKIQIETIMLPIFDLVYLWIRRLFDMHLLLVSI
jgi:hypothetical protein